MLWVSGDCKYFTFLVSESNVNRRQILTYNVDHCAVRVNPCPAELFAFSFHHLNYYLKLLSVTIRRFCDIIRHIILVYFIKL